MRTFAPPVALAFAGERRPRGRVRTALLAAAIGELIADKLPATPSRWSAAGMTGRIGFSGAGGHELGGVPGTMTAASAAIVSAYAGSRIRTSLQGRVKRALAAVAEDALSYTLTVSAVRHRAEAGPSDPK